MNSMPSGVRHSLATSAERPTTTTTSSSTPAVASVALACGKVSSRPVLGSTRLVSSMVGARLVLLRAAVVVHGDHRLAAARAAAAR